MSLQQGTRGGEIINRTARNSTFLNTTTTAMTGMRTLRGPDGHEALKMLHTVLWLMFCVQYKMSPALSSQKHPNWHSSRC